MKRHLPALCAVLALTAPFLAAQTQAVNGTIRGRVTDPAGAPIPNASVTALSSDTGFSRAFDTP